MPSTLFPGERVLWKGQPLRHSLFRSVDVLLVPFSIMFCGFSVFWEAAALVGLAAADQSPPVFFALWGVPFVLVGLYLTVGRLIVRAVASRRTRYMITDHRILVTAGVSGRRATTAYLKDLPPPVITERSDGSGSLAFGSFPGIRDAFHPGNGGRAWASEPARQPVLRDIAYVRRVRDLRVRDLIAQAQLKQGQP